MSTSELKLKRFLYLGSEKSKYVAVNKVKYDFCQLNEVSSIFELITKENEKAILDIIENAHKDPLCTRRETMLYALAVYIRNAKDQKESSRAYDVVLNIIKSNEHLFLFIKFSHSLSKHFSHGFKRMLRNYYEKAQPSKLEKILTLSRAHYGWTHKDVIRAAHLKPTNSAQEILFTYTMKDLKTAKEKSHELIEKNPDDKASLEEIVKNLDTFSDLIHCHDEKEILELIKNNKFELSQIPDAMLKKQAIWDELIPNLSITELLPHLNRLNRMGFLKNNSSTLNKIIETITDNKKCATSKIQPGQVFMYLKFFERGKPIDPQRRNFILGLDSKATPLYTAQVKKDLITHSNPPKNSAIVGALYKLMQHSFKNLYVTGRRVMVTLDVRTENMSNFCFATKSITCIEAAAFVAYSFLKSDKDVTVACFNGNSIKSINTEKSLNYREYTQKLSENTGDFVLLHTPFNYAIENKKCVDVFINIIHSPDALQKVPKEHKPKESILEQLKRYRQKMKLPNTKLINISLHSNKMEIADGSPHVLDVSGFDHYVPKIIDACCKGILQ